jgi:Na+-driven multidrug efflux pump
MVIQGGFRGAGDTRIAMVLSLLSRWGFRIPFAAVLAFAWTVTVPGIGVTITALDWGAEGLWWSYAVGAVLSFLLGAAWFLRGTWKEGVIDRDPDDVEAPAGSEEPRSSPDRGSGIDTDPERPGDD